jgi:hypothetical protein
MAFIIENNEKGLSDVLKASAITREVVNLQVQKH